MLIRILSVINYIILFNSQNIFLLVTHINHILHVKKLRLKLMELFTTTQLISRYARAQIQTRKPSTNNYFLSIQLWGN